MMVVDALSLVLLTAGAFFFFAGTVGLLRFPDVYNRLHAVTKVDNLGLGFVVVALMLQADSWTVVVKLALIWLLAMVSAATAGYLIANSATRIGVQPARGGPERSR